MAFGLGAKMHMADGNLHWTPWKPEELLERLRALEPGEYLKVEFPDRKRQKPIWVKPAAICHID
jgi:hypothetical protein